MSQDTLLANCRIPSVARFLTGSPRWIFARFLGRITGLASISMLLACQEKPTFPEGVYALCKEVSGFSGEVVELNGGKFRYWFYSDVEIEDEPTYPLTGEYRVKGRALTLDNDKIPVSKDRTYGVVNGVDVLWRKDGLELWEKEKRIHLHTVLIRVPGVIDGSKVGERPSINVLYTKEMLDREQIEYEERYNDRPAEVRILLRAYSMKKYDTYRLEIAKARAQPDPKLVAQLVALLGYRSRDALPSKSILADLYTSTWMTRRKPPPFLEDGPSKQKAFEALIDALAGAPDRNALEAALLVFLRGSGVGKIDLDVAGTGIRIILEGLPNAAERFASEGTEVDDVYWLRKMPKLIPACQEWMRAHIPR